MSLIINLIFIGYYYQNLSQILLPHPYNKIGDGPEGPEVRTVADDLRRTLNGKIINNIVIKEKGRCKGLDKLQFPLTITYIRSYGKKLLFDLSSGHLIIFSLGMSGRFQYVDGIHSNVKLIISNTDSSAFRDLYFNDVRHFGFVDIIGYAEINNYFKEIGPDVLNAALDESTWIPLDKWLAIYTQKRVLNRQICVALLDQSLCSGIGNYLKSEILYYSGVHPERLVKTITSSEWDLIRISSHKIILLSYSYGGFTLESFMTPDGKPGNYPAAVYGRKFDPLGNKITKIKTKDARGSYFVDVLQKI